MDKKIVLQRHPFRHKTTFLNYQDEKHEGVFLRSMHMFGRSLKKRFLSSVSPDATWHHTQTSLLTPSDKPCITWIGHSTFLIQIDGITLLTDPIFGNASPLFKRIFPPGIALDQIIPIDYILISHNHRDHMDAPSLYNLRRFNPTVCVPLGLKKWFVQNSFIHTQELSWWEHVEIETPSGKKLTFTFLPAYHWSQRGLLDRNKTLWGSWLIQYDNWRIYFAGDTAYANHFKDIGVEYPHIDIALMPIGPCEPHEWMKKTHMNAQQAVEGFIDLGAHHFVPMHWGTFYFGTDHFSAPLEQLQQSWQTNVLAAGKNMHVFKIGEMKLFTEAAPLISAI